MMIWFAGILQTNTCCNKTDENKTNKKHRVVCVVAFKQLRALTVESLVISTNDNLICRYLTN